MAVVERLVNGIAIDPQLIRNLLWAQPAEIAELQHLTLATRQVGKKRREIVVFLPFGICVRRSRVELLRQGGVVLRLRVEASERPVGDEGDDDPVGNGIALARAELLEQP